MSDSPQPSTHLLPERFRQRLREIVGDDRYKQCLAHFAAEQRCSFRVNTLRCSITEAIEELGQIGLRPTNLGWCDYAFSVSHDERDTLIASALFTEGRIYVQNASSQLAPWVLAAAPGETVLDLAAAPGGKATQIAAMMANQGQLSVVEPIRARFYKLRNTLQVQGVTIARLYMTDGRSVGRKVPDRFDRVLLDAPCSAESRFRLDNPESWAYWSERKIAEQSRKQKGLLASAIQTLKPGGRLLYATCSFAPEENEVVIQEGLRRFEGSVEIVPIELPINNIMPGLAAWNGRTFDPSLAAAVRILPHAEYDGFFLCCLRKAS